MEDEIAQSVKFLDSFFAQFTWNGFWELVFKLLSAILVLVIGFKIIKTFSKKIEKSERIKKVDPGVVSFTHSLFNVTAKLCIVLGAAAILGLPTAAIVAGIGSAGLAIGLALQGSLSNFAGGLMLLIFKPFKIGDYIKVDGDAGIVRSMTLFYTALESPSKGRVVVPNSKVSGSSVQNLTATGRLRVDLDFSAAYSSDIDTVVKALLKVADECPTVLKDPAPTAALSGHGDSALVFTLRFWIKSTDQWNLGYDLMDPVKREFDRLGIEIPFPQLDIHKKAE